jgi:DNA repair protein RadC
MSKEITTINEESQGTYNTKETKVLESLNLKELFVTVRKVDNVKLDIDSIKSTQGSYEAFQYIWEKDMGYRERFYILLLDRKNTPFAYYCLSSGGVSSTSVDVKLIFSLAVHTVASGIILAHNHPSGNLNPSRADLAITEKIVQAGKYLDVKVLDHIILTEDNGYYSFADEGQI